MLPERESAARFEDVQNRVLEAARRGARPADSVTIVLATKGQPPEAIRAAYAAGAREAGENYVQEAARKRAALADLAGLRWHLIGRLQTNKAGHAARNFVLIHSLDSQRLAQALFRVRPAPPVPVLVEVNTGGETSKGGVAPAEARVLLEAVRNLVDLRGLMTIPPPTADPERSRPHFARLRELRERLAAQTGLALSELSMGMSDDFEVAIEEGATIVRIGRAVFGARAR